MSSQKAPQAVADGVGEAPTQARIAPDAAAVRDLRAALALGAHRAARWLRASFPRLATLADALDAAALQTAAEIDAKAKAETHARYAAAVTTYGAAAVASPDSAPN